MAEEAAAKGGLDFLKQKVGPLPLGVWLVIAVGIWYYLKQKQSSSSAAPNQQTDPAGNVGSIDPSTGYVYGSPEDQAALAANNAGGVGATTTSDSGSTTAGTYADNNAWGRAAINYLVGLGIDPTSANEAVQQYLASQTLTPEQQGDVNLAIQALGPPPDLPGPIGTPVPPVTGGGGSGGGGTGGGGSGGGGSGNGTCKKGWHFVPSPGGAVTRPVGWKGYPKGSYPVSGGMCVPDTTPVPPPPGGGGGGGKKTTATNPVTGLTVAQKHTTSLQVKWNKAANATGYHILVTDMQSKKITNQFDVGATQLFANAGGLTPGHSYVVDVWAEPEAGKVGSSAHAHVSVTLPKK